MLRMKRAPILLGLQRKPRKQIKPADDWDEEEWDIQYELKRSSEVIIADDTHAYQAFGDSLFTAPQEDIIEGRQTPSMALLPMSEHAYFQIFMSNLGLRGLVVSSGKNIKQLWN